MLRNSPASDPASVVRRAGCVQCPDLVQFVPGCFGVGWALVDLRPVDQVASFVNRRAVDPAWGSGEKRSVGTLCRRGYLPAFENGAVYLPRIPGLIAPRNESALIRADEQCDFHVRSMME